MISAVKSGLVMAVPILMTGSIALIIRTFFTNLITKGAFFSAVYSIASFIYDATFGIMSLYMACFISMCYIRQFKAESLALYGAPVSAAAGLIILSGGLADGITNGSFGVKGMFTAIVSALLASYLYRKIFAISHRMELFSSGANAAFQNALGSILPFTIVTLVFALLNLPISLTTEAGSFQQLFIMGGNRLFSDMGRSFGSSLLFVFVSSFLWFFGIHGSDVLDHVATDIFEPGIAINASLIAAGSAPTEIYSKTFLDVFVLMGGCGALMSLLVGILLFSRAKTTRRLAKTAALPMVFNVNEIMVFGLPIVFNHLFFIPFILCPIVCLLSSSAAVALGLVPIAVRSVEWTTPILVSGYLATGSIAGTLLQVFNLFLGVAVYYPFVKIYDRNLAKEARSNIDRLTGRLKEAENTGECIILTKQDDESGIIAKMLAAELKKCIADKKLKLFYQPQYNEHSECVGVEALLRWKNESYGMIYPPLMIKLAEETDCLVELEKYIFETAMDDSAYFTETVPQELMISINITPLTLRNPEYQDLLKTYAGRPDFVRGKFCIEITEQSALQTGEQTHDLLKEMHALGYRLAIDDFAMGSTSLKYLQNNDFDLVKLDGSLIRNLENSSSREIIGSILYLSKSLGFDVLAEFVETQQERDQLKDIGCTLYQGYLFSPALKRDELAELLKKQHSERRG